jgi:hypothetical protein
MYYKRVLMRKEKALIPSFGYKCTERVGIGMILRPETY